MRHSKFSLCLLFLFSIISAVSCFGQKTPRELRLNVPIEGEITAGAEQIFKLHLENNQLAVLIADQQGVDTILAIDGADGRRLLEINGNGQIFGNERALFQNDAAPRDLSVRIFPAQKEAKGKFQITLTELKTADERDILRLAAQAAILNGERLTEKNNAESKKQGRDSFENALKLARQSGDLMLETDVLIKLQSSSNDSGDKLKSVEYGRAALALLGDRKDSYDYARIKTILGFSLISMGETKQGIQNLVEILNSARKFGDSSMEIASLIRIAIGYGRLGELEKSIAYAEQANQAAKNIGDKFYQAESLKIISRFHYNRGDFDQSIALLNEALKIAEDLEPNIKFSIYNDLATNFIFLGQLQKALDYLQQTLVYYREVSGNKWNEAATLHSISMVYSNLGQTRRSLEYNNQATQIYSKFGYTDAIIGAARTRGTIYQSLKDYEKARAAYFEALKLSESAGDQLVISALYTSLGSVERKLGHPEVALDHYFKAAEIRKQSKMKAMEAAALMPLADTYIVLEKFAEAAKVAEKSLGIARSNGDRITESNALYHLARTKRYQNELPEALQLVGDSLKIIESLRADLISQESRTAYFSTVRDKYDFYIRLLLELQKLPGNNEYGKLAFAASERARARGLLDLLAESNTDISNGINPELKSREQSVRAKINSLQMQMIQTKSAEKPDLQRIEILQKAIERTDDERERLESEIRRTNPRYAALKYPTTIDLAQTQKLLDDQTVLLEFQVAADASYLFAIGKQDFQIVPLPKQENLREAVESLRRSVSVASRAGLANYLVTGRSLYQTLLAPIENLLKAKTRIIVAADDALNYLPFEVLLTSNTNASLDKLPYLVRDFEISYIPSASVLANLRNAENASAAKPAKSFLAFAAPDYGIGKPDQKAFLAQKIRTVFGENRSWNLSALPNTALEAARIAKLFPAGQSTVFIGQEAREERAASSQILSQYRYLHFAVHGLIDEDQPQFSSLVLSLPKLDDQSRTSSTKDSLVSATPKSAVSNRNSAEDGLLQTPEIFNLRLQADLVTLSACETGLGKDVRGEGIVGLTRAFFYAGTPSVLVSLWKVDDASTAELMTGFYEQLVKTDGRNKAAAMREAQLKMIAGKRYAHPYYWAAFTLQGRSDTAFR